MILNQDQFAWSESDEPGTSTQRPRFLMPDAVRRLVGLLRRAALPRCNWEQSFRTSLAIGTALSLAACVSKPVAAKPNPAAPAPTNAPAAEPSAQSTTAPTRTAELVLTARVVRLGSNGGFVLLSFPVGTAPEVGQTLEVLREGKFVARLRVTSLRRDDLFVADILEGECKAGDGVVDR